MAELTDRRIGRYRVVEKLGEGGMAAVYKAYDPQLDRLVALKMMHTTLMSEKLLIRFEREAIALGKLSHPHIVRVLDSGEQEGSPYLVMEYVPGGQTLRDRLGQPMAFSQAARLLLPVVEAVAYAHQQGIIHRDIKPTNILIGEDGLPKLADFGIAKFLEVEPTIELTGTGVAMGTPDYMAPEQILGQEVDGRADIYALGCVLFETVTGRKPFEANTPMELMFQKVQKTIPRPSELVPDLPAEVEQLILAATEKNAWDRLSSSDTFAEALRQFVHGETTLTKPVFRQLQKAARRGSWRRIAFILSTVVLLGVVLGFLLFRQDREQKLSMLLNQPSATSIYTLASGAVTATPTGTTTPSPILLNSPTPTSTVAALPTATPTLIPTATPVPVRPVIQEDNIGQMQLLHAVNIPSNLLYSAALEFSPDGSLFSVQYPDGNVQIWRTADWQLVFSREVSETSGFVLDPYQYSLWGVLFSPDNSLAIVPLLDRIEGYWTEDWRQAYSLEVSTLPVENDLIYTEISPSGEYLVSVEMPKGWCSNCTERDVGQAKAVIRLWRLQDGSLLHEFRMAGEVTSARFSPDSQLLLVPVNFSEDYFKRSAETWVWRTGDGSFKAVLLDEYSADFSPDSRYLAGRYLWDLSGCAGELDVCGSQINQLTTTGHRFSVGTMFYDNNQLLTENGRIWRTVDGKAVFTIEGFWSMYNYAVSPDGKLAVFEGEPEIDSAPSLYFFDLDRLLVLFDLPGIRLSTMDKLGTMAEGGYFSPDGSLLATTQEGLLRVRRARDGQVVYTFEGIPNISGLSFSPDGRFLIASNSPSEDNTVIGLWGLPLESK